MRIFKRSAILGLALLVICANPLLGSSIVVSDTVGNPGDTAVVVTISLSNTLPYAGFDLDLEYNSTVLVLNRLEAAPRLSNQSGTGYYEFTYGKVSLIVFDKDGESLPADSAVIFNAYFDISPEAAEGEAGVTIPGVTAVSDDLEYDTVTVTNGSILIVPISVEEEECAELLPERYSLQQNYPNPFNPTTQIKFALPRASHAIIEIFNVLGQRVTKLVDKQLPAGYYEFSWNGTDGTGGEVSSAVYFYRLRAGDFVQTRKMVLLK